MIGTLPVIEITEPMMENVDKIVALYWGDEFCEFESKAELAKFIAALQAASKNAFKPLIK